MQCIIGKGGVMGKMIDSLTDEEVAQFNKSADSIKAVIDGLNI